MTQKQLSNNKNS